MDAAAEVFQSTHPSGVRLSARRTRHHGHNHFNPRTPVGCDDITATLFGVSGKFQSTHPSGVRRWIAATWREAIFISIHAPQWGATMPPGTGDNGGRISIHAPQWGATRRKRGRFWGRQYFNPRTPVGCDFPFMVRVLPRRNFNPRTPVGCDVSAGADCRQLWIFQSTHPSGVRLNSGSFCADMMNFNPRTPVGCDLPFGRGEHHRQISIHAPQWGATQWSFDRRLDVLFQSTHPSGVRLADALRLRLVSRISIHAPQWGATAQSGYVVDKLFDFNPRTPVGCDRENGHSIP